MTRVSFCKDLRSPAGPAEHDGRGGARMPVSIGRNRLIGYEEQLLPGQQSFFRAINVSVTALLPKVYHQYGSLAVLLEDMPGPAARSDYMRECPQPQHWVRDLLGDAARTKAR